MTQGHYLQFKNNLRSNLSYAAGSTKGAVHSVFSFIGDTARMILPSSSDVRVVPIEK